MNVDRRSFLGAGISLAAWQDVVARDASTLGHTPHTRFAVNIEMWWRKLPFLERVRQVIAFGFPGIEFWPWKGVDLDGLEKMSKDAGLEIAQFTAWGFKPGMNNPDNHAAFVEAIRAGCEVAHKLDAKRMTVVAGNDQPGMTTEQMHAHVIAGLKLAAPIAEDANVTLILEPMNGRVDHPGHCLYGSPDAIRICAAVGSTHVKLNWDLYHMQISEGDLCGRLREGFEHVGYLQLADHPGRNEPGTGEIHYPRVLQEAYELGYRGLVGLECYPRDGEITGLRRVAAADRW
jgi:hydroxypyruvate isomerase